MRREMLAVEEGRLPSLELPPDGTRLALAGEANSRPFDEGSQPVTKVILHAVLAFFVLTTVIAAPTHSITVSS